MKTKVYQLDKCGTCKKASSWLAKHGIVAEFIPIKQKTPSISELKRAYAHYKSWNRIFNTSGMEYRARNLSEKISSMTDREIFNLLTENGMLIRRPFLVTEKRVAVGFKESEWEDIFKNEK